MGPVSGPGDPSALPLGSSQQQLAQSGGSAQHIPVDAELERAAIAALWQQPPPPHQHQLQHQQHQQQQPPPQQQQPPPQQQQPPPQLHQHQQLHLQRPVLLQQQQQQQQQQQHLQHLQRLQQQQPLSVQPHLQHPQLNHGQIQPNLQSQLFQSLQLAPAPTPVLDHHPPLERHLYHGPAAATSTASVDSLINGLAHASLLADSGTHHRAEGLVPPAANPALGSNDDPAPLPSGSNLTNPGMAMQPGLLGQPGTAIGFGCNGGQNLNPLLSAPGLLQMLPAHAIGAQSSALSNQTSLQLEVQRLRQQLQNAVDLLPALAAQSQVAGMAPNSQMLLDPPGPSAQPNLSAEELLAKAHMCLNGNQSASMRSLSPGIASGLHRWAGEDVATSMQYTMQQIDGALSACRSLGSGILGVHHQVQGNQVGNLGDSGHYNGGNAMHYASGGDSTKQLRSRRRRGRSDMQERRLLHGGRGDGRRETDNADVYFKVNVPKILSGEDTRTTLMIRNIPNKYDQRQLLKVLERNHRGRFDLFYLPIDFKNCCNVGYAFINVISLAYLPEFCLEFKKKKWENFNSEKVCDINYARIQGKASLIAHFQNSALMHEDESMQPVVFRSDGSSIREKIQWGGPKSHTSASSSSTARREHRHSSHYQGSTHRARDSEGSS